MSDIETDVIKKKTLTDLQIHQLDTVLHSHICWRYHDQMNGNIRQLF